MKKVSSSIIFLRKKGSSLIEILLAVAILALFSTAVIGSLVYARESTVSNGFKKRALLLAEEGLEAVRSIRDQSYDNLTDGNYGLSVDSYHWVLSSLPETIDGFTREVSISEIDPDSKKIVVTISWETFLGRQKTLSLESILSNWRESVPLVPKWQTPRLTAKFDISGTNDAQRVFAVGDYVYVTRADGINDFSIINVADDSAPTFASGLNLTGQPKDVYVSGNYAYVASTEDTGELQIIDVSDSASPTQVASYDANGTADANAIWVSGNYAYIVRGTSNRDELIVVDITDPLSPTLAGSLNLGATAYDIRVDGNYAYIASASNTQEVQIVDVSDPASLSISGAINMVGNTNAVALEVGDGYLYVSRGGKIEIYDISSPTAPIGVLSYNAVRTAFDLSIDTDNDFLFLATQGNVNEVEIVDISNPSSAVQKSIYDMTGTEDALGISYEATKDRLYVVSGRDTEELYILAPY